MSIDQQIADIAQQIVALNEKRDALQGRRMIKCRHCDRKMRISGVVFYQTYWYDNATYSEAWYPGEWVVWCRHCGERNRGNLYSKDEAARWAKLSRYFLRVEKVYDK